MCILFWKVNGHPQYRLIFAGNRDEFLDRPTAPAHFWPEEPNVLAGTDLEESATPGHNGTWLGITRSGRFSALTNYREKKYFGRRSRGILVRDFLLDSTVSPKQYMERLAPQSEQFGGFSLLCIDLTESKDGGYYYSNRDNMPITELHIGQIYGLSNTVLTKPWEKVTRGTSLLDNILHDHQQRNGTEADLVEDLFAMLGLTSEFTDTTDVEKMLEESKERICLPKFTLYTGPYATRTSTVILVSHDGHVTFVERDRFQSSGSPDGFTPLTYTKGEGRAFHFDIDLSAKQNKNEST